MVTATAAVSIVLAALISFAAVRKLSHHPDVVASYVRVGVPEGRLDQLAYVLLMGATGLILGLLWAPVGTAAAIALTLYFALAIVAHLRHGDAAGLPVPATILALAAAAAALHLSQV